MPAALLAKAHEKGLRESLRLGCDIARAGVSNRSSRRGRVFLFLSPPMNNSGAPQILMQVVEEFAHSYEPGSVRLLSPHVIPEMRGRADLCGIRVERAAEVMSPMLVGLQLAVRADDFVLMNTVAVPTNYRTFILGALRSEKLAHAYWYIHEDIDQLAVTAPNLLRSDLRSFIGQLVNQSRLTLLVPSRKVKAQYDDAFKTTRTTLLPFKVEVDRTHTARRPAGDYASVRFLLSGGPTDGRKGHMIAMAAFHEFMNSYHERTPERYRPFTVTLVGMTDDHIANQIRSIGATVLGERLQIVPSVPHNEALSIARQCNAVLCCSFNEALPLYVFEGMCMGHIVLRNDAGGMEEQLDQGVNGFQIDSRDIRQFASVLAAVLDKEAMPDSRLQAMGQASQDMIARLQVASYVDALEGARHMKGGG